jgi:long-chain acyl-CoA synthetase
VFTDFISVDPLSPDAAAIIWREQALSYAALLEKRAEASEFLKESGVEAGSVVGLKGDFTPSTVAILLALIERRTTIVPFTNDLKPAEESRFGIAEVETMIEVDRFTDRIGIRDLGRRATHPILMSLRSSSVPGLVLFTSGSSGTPKAAVHDFSKLLDKFRTRREALRTLNFLLFDHWGGLNTLFHTLSNGGTVVATSERSPDAICRLIETHKVELLPASPTFLRLLLLSEADRRHDLSSLRLITYGTEPMPPSTLERLKERFSGVRIQQTYGLIELGVMRTKSRGDGSLWMTIGGEGFDVRIVNGLLEIKAASAMLGYLNAPSPFTDDGYFMTGDMVEVDGPYIKVLGRQSEIINVGGEKVYPQEVEDAILGFDEVADCMVFGEKHYLTGNIVCAIVKLKVPENTEGFALRLRKFLRARLPAYKVPVKIKTDDSLAASDRFKKVRQPHG